MRSPHIIAAGQGANFRCGHKLNLCVRVIVIWVGRHQVRQQLEGLAQALGVSMLRAARLASRVPTVWERPPVEAADKVRAMASELDLGVEATLDLYGSQPGIWAVKHPSIIKDR